MAESLDQQILSVVQSQFGSSNFDKFQALRFVWYSKQTYPQAGTTNLSFFGDVVGQNSVTYSTTNMTRANSFSQRYFLMRSIRTHFYLGSAQMSSATLANTYLPNLHDVANSASYLTFKIQDKEYLRVAMPLLYMPPGFGITHNQLNLANTAGNSFQSYGAVSPRKDDVFVLEPPQLIEAETVFNIDLSFAAAVALPSQVTGTVAVYLDGIVFRPLQ